jgi:hypothetical protein
MAMIVKRERNKLKIELPLEAPTPSKSGKSDVVASSRGVVMTQVQYKGKPVAVVVNAFIYRDRVNRNPVSQTQAIRKSVALSDSTKEKGKKL